MNANPVSLARIARSIVVIRNQRVMLSGDLAALYGVEARTLIQAVKRNLARFPADFLFQLTHGEVASLRSQNGILRSAGRGPGRHSKYAPYAFTEQGVAMLSSVLRSRSAIAVNIEIMRAFVQLRGLLASNRELAKRLAKFESETHSPVRRRLRCD